MYKKVFIIAEAGVNHNGKVKIAKRMIDVASEAGADAVKFQTFKTKNFICKSAPKADYQKNSTTKDETQYGMLEKLELSLNDHKKLINHCKKKDIVFLSSPFDLESVELLENLGIEIFKIPSGEIINLPYLRRIGSLRKKIIMSTGMANLLEIGKALNILIKTGTPKKYITVLHCNAEYPTAMKDVNLKAMLAIRDTFKVDVGYSDHTLGMEVPVAAVALGATVIEKHFTLDKNMEGPDHKASLEPDGLKRMIEAIRNIEKSLGSGIKKPSSPEQKNKRVVRKSIVAARDIREGELFTTKNITAKRPATGTSPMEWNSVIGKAAKRDFGEDELIEL